MLNKNRLTSASSIRLSSSKSAEPRFRTVHCPPTTPPSAVCSPIPNPQSLSLYYLLSALGPGDHSHGNHRSTCFFKYFGNLAAGGAGGKHVVDQQHPGALQRVMRTNAKRPAHVAKTLLGR